MSPPLALPLVGCCQDATEEFYGLDKTENMANKLLILAERTVPRISWPETLVRCGRCLVRVPLRWGSPGQGHMHLFWVLDPEVGSHSLSIYSLFTLRKPRFQLRINGEQSFLRVDRLQSS